MSVINHEGITNKIISNGEVITIRNYAGTTPSYDSDQEPIHQYSSGTLYSLITEPSKLDIQSSAGLITSVSKKFIFDKNTDIDISDEIIYSSGTFRCIEIHEKFTRKVAFANRYQNS